MSSPTSTNYIIRFNRENNLQTFIRQYPKRHVAHPPPYQVTNPFGSQTGFKYADLSEPFVAIPIVIEAFQKLVEAFLAEQIPVRPAIEPPLQREESRQKILESLVFLGAQLKTFGKKEGEIPPKEIVKLLLQINSLIQELEKTPQKLPIKEQEVVQQPATEEFLQEGADELEKTLPKFVETLRSSLPQLSRTLPYQIKQAVEEFLQEPQIQNLPTPQKEERTKEVLQKPVIPPRLLTEESLTRALVPTTRETPLITPERVLRIYPSLLPLITQEKENAPSLPLNKGQPTEGVFAPLASMIVKEIPVVSATIDLGKEMTKIKESKDLIFGFIVPFIVPFPINPAHGKAKTGPRDPVEDIEPEDDEVGEEAFQLLVFVDGDTTWYGDPMSEGEVDERPLRHLPIRPFSIGVFPVTNQQYADFLKIEAKEGRISIDKKGKVISLSGQVLCQTKGGNMYSDIQAEAHKRFLGFSVTKGKESCPVTCVTYYGANAYCEAGGFRLPTELEWEKAAGVQIDSSGKIERKFRYAFQKDLIDPSLATYNEASTTPVGLYNGISTCTKNGATILSSSGLSPFGCYDMSGNVWEWTSTGDGGEKIVKGGSFKSSKYDLRVARRVSKDMNSLDDMTGFRVARS